MGYVGEEQKQGHERQGREVTKRWGDCVGQYGAGWAEAPSQPSDL